MKNENVICVPVEAMKRHFDMSLTSWHISNDEINGLPHSYLFRPEVEKDFTQKQLIPYALVINQNGQVLCYQRAGSEKRLSGIWSAGIGGHVNDQDKADNVFDTLINGLIREFQEEIGVTLRPEQIELVGMINEEETEVGYCHTGVVFKLEAEDNEMNFDAEICNPTWKHLSEIDYSKFEIWSALAIKLL